MMELTASKALRGEVTVPGDKSISHRSVMFGAIAQGMTEVTNFLQGADCLSTISCFQKLGIEIENTPERILVHGKGLHGLSAPSEVLDAGNSGTTTRLISGILSGQTFETTLTEDASIQKRPMKRIMEPLSLMGAKIESVRKNGCAPLHITGGSLHGITYSTPVASAQVKSSILLAGLYADGPTSVTEPALSRNHTELMLSDAMGFEKDKIMFSSNVTPAAEYQLAAELGAIINLDDITHIDFLEKTLGYIPKKICCRYNPGGLFKISTDIMDNPGDAKYGMTKEQMKEAFKRLKKMGAKRFGIHSFLASNTVSNEYYPTLAGILFDLAVELKEETGVEIAFINLSGGVGIPYTPDKEPNDIAVIGEGVRKQFEKIMVPAGLGDVAIFTELGRFMLAPYGGLVTKAIHEKHIYKEYIGVDACAVNLMRPAMYGAYHHITVLGKEDAPCDHKYDVTGSLCENNDKFAVDRMLPKIDMGDYLFIHDAGAHGFAMGYNYNGKLKSAELLLQEDGSVKMIRRAETPKDYFATFDFSDILKDVKYE